MRLVFRPEALQELVEARDWYDGRKLGLGLEFVSHIEVAVERILRSPLHFVCIHGEFRSVVVRKFPYSIIYHANDQELVVISVFHHRREPGAWKKRTEHLQPDER